MLESLLPAGHMNTHHLELFYYVAKHRGIAEAVRKIPWGIQQPAVSSQIAELERTLGTPLFQRRPFALTPQGDELFRFIEPFFGKISDVAEKLRGNANELIRIAASAMVLRDYLPGVLTAVRRQFPQLRFTLVETGPGHVESLFERQEVDLAIAVFERKPSRTIHSEVLLELTPALMLPSRSRIKSVAQLWENGVPQTPLISLPPEEALTRAFQRGLAAAGLSWAPSIEVSSLDLIETYVAGGFGAGITIAAPTAVNKRGAHRILPLADFPKLQLTAAWVRLLPPCGQLILEMIRAQASSLKRD